MKTFRASTTLDEQQMGRLAAAIGTALEPGMRVHLQGDLGAGKTTLVRALIRSLGHQGAVKSPTYGLLEPYELEIGPVCHLDLYRLGHPEELEYLGLRDLLASNTLLLVEWPERGVGYLPPPDLLIALQMADIRREITLEAQTERAFPLVENWLAIQSLFN